MPTLEISETILETSSWIAVLSNLVIVPFADWMQSNDPTKLILRTEQRYATEAAAQAQCDHYKNNQDRTAKPVLLRPDFRPLPADCQHGELCPLKSVIASRYGSDSAISNGDNVVENTTAAESRIRDMDMATGMVMESMLNILDQAGE